MYGAQVIAPDQSLLILPGGFLLGTAAVFLRARHFELNLREGMGTAFAMALLAYFLRVVLGGADDPAWQVPAVLFAGFGIARFLPSREK